MTKILNRTSELEKRRILRANATEAEKQIWAQLRKRNIKDYKFRRQYSIGPYIVDFYCPQAKLAVEIDGSVHSSEDAIEYDRARDEFIKSIGIQVLRFTNNEVDNNPKKIIDKIIKAIEPKISPPNKGGDGRRPEGVKAAKTRSSRKAITGKHS